jgi:hypothetical protein
MPGKREVAARFINRAAGFKGLWSPANGGIYYFVKQIEDSLLVKFYDFAAECFKTSPAEKPLTAFQTRVFKFSPPLARNLRGFFLLLLV